MANPLIKDERQRRVWFVSDLDCSRAQEESE